MQVAGLTSEPPLFPRLRGGPFHDAANEQVKKESRKSAAYQLISRSDCFDLLDPFLSGAAEEASRRDDNRLPLLQPVFLQKHRPCNLPAAFRILADMSPVPFYHLQLSFPERHYIISGGKNKRKNIQKRR